MRHLIFLLLTTTAFAQLKDVDSQVLAFKNLLKNGGFENGATGWSATGSATVIKDTTYPAFGKSHGQLDFSAASEYIRSQAVTVPKGLYGKNCIATFKYQGGGSADIYYRVTDGTNTLAGYTSTSTQFKITTSASTYQNSLDMTFPCPSSGSVKLELEGAGNAAALYLDDAYIGENFKVGSVAQAELVGTLKYAGTANCVWESGYGTGGAFTNYNADTDCPTPSTSGSLVYAGTKIPAATMNNVKSGRYMVVVSGNPYIDGATTSCRWAIGDGTTNAGIVGGYGMSTASSPMGAMSASFEYTTAQSSITWQIKAVRTSGASDCEIYNSETTTNSLEFQVYRFPLSSEVAVSANVPDQGGTLTYAKTTNCQWANTSASFANFSADTDCATPSVSGNVSAPATKIPAMLINSLEAGKYLVIVQGVLFANGSADCEYRLSDGTNTSSYASTYSTAGDRANTLIGYFNYTAKQTSLTIQVQASKTSGTSCDIRAGDNNFNLQMSLIPLSPSVAMPNIVGSVTSNTTASERVERVSVHTVCSSSPCTITSQSGSWLTNITRTGTGQYKLNFASGMFSVAPVCMPFALDQSGLIAQRAFAVPTTSAFEFYTTAMSTGTPTDSNFTVMCMGAR